MANEERRCIAFRLLSAFAMSVTTLSESSSKLVEEFRNGSGNSPGLLNVFPLLIHQAKTASVENVLLEGMSFYSLLDPSPITVDTLFRSFNGIVDFDLV